MVFSKSHMCTPEVEEQISTIAEPNPEASMRKIIAELNILFVNSQSTTIVPLSHE